MGRRSRPRGLQVRRLTPTISKNQYATLERIVQVGENRSNTLGCVEFFQLPHYAAKDRTNTPGRKVAIRIPGGNVVSRFGDLVGCLELYVKPLQDRTFTGRGAWRFKRIEYSPEVPLRDLLGVFLPCLKGPKQV